MTILKTNVDLLIKLSNFSWIIDFPYFLFNDFLNVHHWFNITNIIPSSLDDSSLEPKRYSADFISQ